MKSLRSVFVYGMSGMVLPAYAAGIPQMDQTWYANQLLWLAVSFAALYAIVSLFIAPTAAKILGAREHAINEAVAQAERAKREAESTRTGYEAGDQSARAKAAELMAQAQAAISRDASERLAVLDTELAHKASQAEARIADARAKAAASMQQATSDLAGAMASKLLGRAVTSEEAVAATSPIVNLKKAG